MTPHFPQRIRHPRSRRGGYTLAELLIVLTIMVMLMALTLPIARKVLEDGNTREASRELNAYFAMAKSRAQLTGRPCGVLMICDTPLGIIDANIPVAPNIPTWPVRQVRQMFLAEVPPPYSGSTLESRGRIIESVTVTTTPKTYEFYPIVKQPDLVLGFTYVPETSLTANPAELSILFTLIEPGEQFLVRFDHKGAWFVCHRIGAQFIFQNPIKPVGLTQAGTSYPIPPRMTDPLPPDPKFPGYTFQVMRMPRRIGNPLELTPGTCIDLTYSGFGPNNMPSTSLTYGMYPTIYAPGLAPLKSIAVMFQPGGGVDSVFLNNLPQTPPTTIHFLVGRDDKMDSPFSTNANHPTNRAMYDPNVSNLADPLSLWLSIGRSTGIVVTSDSGSARFDIRTASPANITLFPGTTRQHQRNPTDPFDQLFYLSYCRELATNREQAKTQ